MKGKELTAPKPAVPSDEESTIPNVRQPHLEVHLGGGRSRDDTLNTTYVRAIHLEGREACGVGSSGHVSPSRIATGARNRGVGDGEDGG